MKKKVLLLVMASFLIAGVVSAASLWGSYKGNQIIRLTVDGDPVRVSDVPAISYQGRTMIPIYLLQQAGIQYSWDGKNQTVDILKPVGNVPSTGDVDKLKAYVAAADYYASLDNLGDMIRGLSDHLSLVYEGDSLGKGTKPDYNRLNTIIDTYNRYVNEYSSKYAFLSSHGVNINEATGILNNYSAAIDAYKKAFSGMDKFILNHSDQNFDEYLDNSSRGADFSFDGIVSSGEQYDIFIRNALNH